MWIVCAPIASGALYLGLTALARPGLVGRRFDARRHCRRIWLGRRLAEFRAG